MAAAGLWKPRRCRQNLGPARSKKLPGALSVLVSLAMTGHDISKRARWASRLKTENEKKDWPRLNNSGNYRPRRAEQRVCHYYHGQHYNAQHDVAPSGDIERLLTFGTRDVAGPTSRKYRESVFAEWTFRHGYRTPCLLSLIEPSARSQSSLRRLALDM